MRLPALRERLQTVYFAAVDALEVGLGLRDSLSPPRRMFSDPDRTDGSRNEREFREIGNTTVRWLIDEEGLNSTHTFLDVGCGIGRMAIPLMSYLQEGKYHGFDISKNKIAYCKRTVLRRRPDFAFHHADVFNKYYNPAGKIGASEYRFPYDEGMFDFVLLSSVFTHMLPPGMMNYLSEIARVLAPGGKCVISYWLSDQKKGPPYHSISDVCEIYSLEEPEHGVVYLERFVTGLYEKLGLRIEEFLRGSDRQRPDSNSGSRQDIVIAVKSNGRHELEEVK